MAGVFFEIRNWLRQEYGGRYIAILLSELADRDPQSFARIINQAPKKGPYDWEPFCADIRKRTVQTRREFPFGGLDDRRRLADLAFLRRDGTPAALIEVKDEDDFHAEQLDDYLAQVKRGIPFIHLSRYAPDPGEEQRMEDARVGGGAVASIRYRDVHRVLRKTQHPFTTSVREYLEDIGVGAYVPIDKKEERATAFLLTQLLGFTHAQGLGRLAGKQAVTDFPTLVGRMFDNLEFVAEWVREPNRQLIGTRFTRKLLPRPEFDLPKLAKAVQRAITLDEVTAVDELPGAGKYVESGEVLFYAGGKIRTKAVMEWLYLEVGFGLQISKGSSKRPAGKRLVHPRLYTTFHGQKLKSEDTYDDTDYLNAFPTEERALSLFRECLTASLKKALAKTNGPTNTALSLFVVPPPP